MDQSGGRIDTHHHVMHEFWREAVAPHSPGAGFREPHWSPEAALALMDETSTRAAILSTPAVHFGDDAQALDLARRVNDATAEIVKDRPDRFGLFASLPVPDLDASLGELARCYDELGADGVVLLANTHGTYLGTPELDPLMAELDRRGAVLFVHPDQLPGTPAAGIPPFLADFLLDTVRAAISLVLHDVPSRFPNLKIILSHGGGFLPYIPGRLAHTMGVMGVSEEQLAQLHSFWFDLALTPGPSSLPSLLSFADPGRITYGSDFPYTTPETVTRFSTALETYPLEADLRSAIDHCNAELLFPRLALR